jgi:lysozyme
VKRPRRQWLVAAFGALVLVVALLAFGWFVWLPGYRPSLHPGERLGIDVSHHQGRIDWPAVADDGITFAYIKASEGVDLVDPQFARNWRGAREIGIDRGAYHFFSLCSPGDDQARAFLDVLPDDAELPPALDLELAGNCTARPDPSVVARELRAFLSLVEGTTGPLVVLYVGDEFEDAYPVRDTLPNPLWIRRFLRRPGVDWLVWQVDGYARVAGIDGTVDLDVMKVVP